MKLEFGFCYNSNFNPKEQHDADEFLNSLFDKLENCLPGTNKDLLKRTFGGYLASEIICKGCPHGSLRKELFYSLTLFVKNKRSIYEALDSFIQGDSLEGSNAYYCDKCKRKVDAIKRHCLLEMPNVLIVVLKRFDFNYETLQRVKINDYCEFETEINLQKYSY